MELPTISLAIDNCFASKRWTRPAEWMEMTRHLGLSWVEASADTEADPLYAGPEYMSDWVEDVLRSSQRSGVRVANLYSGHGTYATLGLAHPDARVRERMRERWLKPMIRAAARLNAGLGFFCHAFPESVLQSGEEYARYVGILEDELAEIATYGAEQGAGPVGLEQMYSPHQFPWTIDGARHLVESVYAKGRSPFYLTIDTGHQTGQRRFARPDRERVRSAAGGRSPGGHALWLGSLQARSRFDSCVRDGGGISDGDMAVLDADMDRHPHLFSSERDADCYAWLSALGSLSPIVHLQQVTGGVSAHLPFTEETNARGIIHPRKVLGALAESYLHPAAGELPPAARRIFLTLEIFSGTAETREEIAEKLDASVRYWRSFVPRDGMKLDDILDHIG